MIANRDHEGRRWRLGAEYLPIPGCVSQGKTRKDSLRNLQKAIKGCRAVRHEKKGAVGECG